VPIELLLLLAGPPLLGALVGLVLTFTVGRRKRSVWWLGWPVALTGAVGGYLPWLFSAFCGEGIPLMLLRLLLLPGFIRLVCLIGTLHFTLLFGQVVLAMLGLTQTKANVPSGAVRSMP
jgi:Mg/Co/Ni transporter MgtE